MICSKRINLLKYFNQPVIVKRKPFHKFQENVVVLQSALISNIPRKKFSESEKLKIKEEILAEEKQKYENTFGTIEAFEAKFRQIEEDPEDLEDYRKDKAALGKTIRQYVQEIHAHLKNNDYKSAINTLEIDMVNDKKRPVSHIYDMLVSYNARIGNLKEAYRLFVNFKKRQGMVNGGMYTSLFNACANCDNSFFALKKANDIRESIKNDKHHHINTSNYNAMLKAYGRHGDLPTCFQIFDEVMEKNDKIKNVTYSFLFQACISDKNAGLRHALILWRKMLQYRVKPDKYIFNLILRCVRECSLGDIDLLNEFMAQIKAESGKFYKKKTVIKTIGNTTKRIVTKIPTSGKGVISTESVSSEAEEEKSVSSLEDCTPQITSEENNSEESAVVECSVESNNICPSEPALPNLLEIIPNFGSVISFNVMTAPHLRFLCLGGLKGFLKVMSQFNVKPDIKTFTLLLDVIGPNLEAEKELLAIVRRSKVDLDTGFFNVLIMRRNKRGDHDFIEEVLKDMQEENVKPDIITFGVLALGCTTIETGIQLIQSARSFGIRLNNEILCPLLHNAGIAHDMKYVKVVLNAAKEDEVKLNQRFIAKLGKIVDIEKARMKKIEEPKEKSEELE